MLANRQRLIPRPILSPIDPWPSPILGLGHGFSSPAHRKLTSCMIHTTQYHHDIPAGQSLKKVSLGRLMRFGSPPLSMAKILESAELSRMELCERLQRRVNAHLSLPYLPASNPHIKEVMSIYRHSFKEISAIPPIRSIDDNTALVKALVTMVDDAADVIGMFATGFKESKRYLSDEQINSFLNGAIRSRISMRLIAEQHLALSKTDQPCSDNRVGIVDKRLKLSNTLESVLKFVGELCEATYGLAPQWKILGEVNTKVCFVEMHLQYVLIEVIKNAFRATVEHHRHLTKTPNPTLPPVEITFSVQNAPPVTMNSEDPARLSLSEPQISQSLLCIRIRDQGGGIDPQVFPHIFSYAFSTVGQAETPMDTISHQADLDRISYGQDSLKSSLGRIAGLGFGLPMARLYCRYFDGNLELVNIHGMGGGVDVYITMTVGSDQN